LVYPEKSSTRKRALWMLQNGLYDGIGTDVHRMKENLESKLVASIQVIRDMGGNELLSQLGFPAWIMPSVEKEKTKPRVLSVIPNV